MEIGRTKLLEAIAMPVHKITEEGFVPVLISTEIHFKTPLLLGDVVYVNLWLSELCHASAIMSFEFSKSDGTTNNRTIAAIAKQKGVFVDRETMKPYRLKPHQREKFAKFLNIDDIGRNKL